MGLTKRHSSLTLYAQNLGWRSRSDGSGSLAPVGPRACRLSTRSRKKLSRPSTLDKVPGATVWPPLLSWENCYMPAGPESFLTPLGGLEGESHFFQRSDGLKRLVLHGDARRKGL